MRSIFQKGVLHPGALLTPEKVVEIRSLSAGGESATSISKRFGVHPNTILNVLHNRTWRHV